MGFKAVAPVAARCVAAGLILGGWAASAGVSGADPEPAPPPAPKTTIDHDGIYAVGTDIAPGTYSSAGPVGNGTCYWKRLGNPDGALIDNALSKKPQVVQIDPTDKAFKTTGCQPWQLSPDANPPANTPPAGVQGTLGILNGLLGGQNGQQAPQPGPPQPGPPQPGPPQPGPPHS
jgi:hypothetical protein